MKNIKLKNSYLAIMAAVALFHVPAQAQDQGLGDMIFIAGTVEHTSSPAQDWAWIHWMTTDNALLQGTSMDIYLKQGDATSTNLFTLKGRAMQVTDPRIITTLLARGEMLGENLLNLVISGELF